MNCSTSAEVSLCDTLIRTNEQQHIRGDTQKVQRQEETHNHSNREGQEENKHSRMKKRNPFALLLMENESSLIQ